MIVALFAFGLGFAAGVAATLVYLLCLLIREWSQALFYRA